MASTELRRFLEMATKKPTEQAAAGQVPMPPVIFLLPDDQAQGSLHQDLLGMIGKILVDLGEVLLQSKTYKKTHSAESVLQGLADVTNAAYKNLAGSARTKLLTMGPPSPNHINREVLNENVHKELLEFLFTERASDPYTFRQLDSLLEESVSALSRFPLDQEGKKITLSFFVGEVFRKNKGNDRYPRWEEFPAIKFHMMQIPTEVYRDLVNKNEEKPVKEDAKKASAESAKGDNKKGATESKNTSSKTTTSTQNQTSTAPHAQSSFMDMLNSIFGKGGDREEEEPEPEPPHVLLNIQHHFLSATLSPEQFQQERGAIDAAVKKATGMSAAEYGEKVVKKVRVSK